MLTSQTPPRPRRGVSLIEIIVAMTLLAFVVGSLSVLSAKSARRGPELDKGSARAFVVMQQANRFSVLPYDSITAYAPRVDTVITGRFQYLRRVVCVKLNATSTAYDEIPCTTTSTTSEYKTIKVLLQQVGDTMRRDSLIFARAKTYEHSPLFTQ